VKGEKAGMRTTFVKAAIQLKLENVRLDKATPCSNCLEKLSAPHL
jgi:hypothetical protein